MIITYKTVLLFVLGIITVLLVIDAWKDASKELIGVNNAYKYKLSYCMTLLVGSAFLARLINDLP